VFNCFPQGSVFLEWLLLTSHLCLCTWTQILKVGHSSLCQSKAIRRIACIVPRGPSLGIPLLPDWPSPPNTHKHTRFQSPCQTQQHIKAMVLVYMCSWEGTATVMTYSGAQPHLLGQTSSSSYFFSGELFIKYQRVKGYIQAAEWRATTSVRQPLKSLTCRLSKRTSPLSMGVWNVMILCLLQYVTKTLPLRTIFHLQLFSEALWATNVWK
jgi:hypothetical protein